MYIKKINHDWNDIFNIFNVNPCNTCNKLTPKPGNHCNECYYNINNDYYHNSNDDDLIYLHKYSIKELIEIKTLTFNDFNEKHLFRIGRYH